MGLELSIAMDQKIQSAIISPDFPKFIVKTYKKIANLVLAEYKKEMPVNTDFARNSVFFKVNNDSLVVSTDATSKGKPYPVFVHEGTGRWAGLNVDYPSSGRIRAGTVGHNTGGIRPNKFAWRARNNAEPKVIKKFKEELDDHLSTVFTRKIIT